MSFCYIHKLLKNAINSLIIARILKSLRFQVDKNFQFSKNPEQKKTMENLQFTHRALKDNLNISVKKQNKQSGHTGRDQDVGLERTNTMYYSYRVIPVTKSLCFEYD